MNAILDMSLAELDETLASGGRPPRPGGGTYSIYDGTPPAAPNFDTPPPTGVTRPGVRGGVSDVRSGFLEVHSGNSEVHSGFLEVHSDHPPGQVAIDGAFIRTKRPLT